MRRAAKRDASEREIVDALRKCGVTVYLLDQPVDALLGYRGETTLAEFKTGKAKLNANQVRFIDAWRGSAVVTMRTAGDALAWINGELVA
jgi:hypothetical protein